MTDLVTKDLSKFAADKATETIYAIMELVDDPLVKAQIALMAASACIGTASGCLAAAAKKKGFTLSQKEAELQVLEIMRVLSAQGVDAAVAAMVRK